MGKTNRICKTCGKAYYYCTNCDKSVNSPQWMLMWDTENCKNIFQIVSNFEQGVYDEKTARKKLEKCDLKQKYTFNPKIIKTIDKIMAKGSVSETKESVEEKEDTQKRGRLFSEKKTEEEK